MPSVSVMSYMSGYQYFIYERFVGSLNDTGFTGDINLIIQNKDLIVVKKLQEKYKNVKFLIDNLSKPIKPHMRRFILFKQMLQNILNSENNPDYILICDGRDVLFQKNLEEFDLKHDIYFSEEKIVFTQCPIYNCGWLKLLERVFSEKFFENIKHNKVLCSGTTIGKFDSIKKYVDIMYNIISKYNWGDFHGDQGIHNYLYYTNKYKNIIDDIKIIRDSDGFIGTIGAPISLNLKNLNTLIIKDGKIYDNTDEEKLFYVVHQWDRLSDEDRKKISVKYDFNHGWNY